MIGRLGFGLEEENSALLWCSGITESVKTVIEKARVRPQEEPNFSAVCLAISWYLYCNPMYFKDFTFFYQTAYQTECVESDIGNGGLQSAHSCIHEDFYGVTIDNWNCLHVFVFLLFSSVQFFYNHAFAFCDREFFGIGENWKQLYFGFSSAQR